MSITTTTVKSAATKDQLESRAAQQDKPSAPRSSIQVVTPDPLAMMLTATIPHRSVTGLTPMATHGLDAAPAAATVRPDAKFGDYILGQTLGEGESTQIQAVLGGAKY